MKSKLLVVILVLGTVLAEGKNLIKNADFNSGLKYWHFQAGKDRLAKVNIKKEGLVFSREKKGFCRLYQDVSIKKSGVYEFSAKVQVPKNSRLQIWFLYQTKSGKWLEKNVIFIRYGSNSNKVKILNKTLQVPEDIKTVRINLAAMNKGTTVTVKELTFNPSSSNAKSGAIGCQKIPYLKNCPVKFDGSLDKNWTSNALKLSDFRKLGNPDVKAHKKSEIYLATNKDSLIIGIKAYAESCSEKLDVNVQNNGFNVFSGNCVELFFSKDRYEFFHVGVNRSGAKALEVKNLKSINLRTWYDGASLGDDFCDVKSNNGKDFWTAEVVIPLKNIFENDRGSCFYANFCRTRPHDEIPHASYVHLLGKTYHVPLNFQKFVVENNFSKGLKKKTVTKLISKKKGIVVKDILSVGEPLKLIKGNSNFIFPGKLKYVNKTNFAVTNSIQEWVSDQITVFSKNEVVIEYSRITSDDIADCKKNRLLKGNEAFMLEVTANKIVIKANHKDGLLRGLSSLVTAVLNRKRQGRNSLKTFTMYDAPLMKIRGWQISGNVDEFKKQLDLFFLLRYNTFQFELSSYGKCSKFPFQSYPDLHDGKMSIADWREVISYARARGIEPVPILNAWARAPYILNRDKYAFLAEYPERRTGFKYNRRVDRNFCAANPESYKMIFRMYDEIIDKLGVKNLHIGLDEVHYDGISKSKLAKKLGRTPSDWMKDVILKSYKHLKDKKVRMWLYADNLIPWFNGHFIGINSEQDFKKLEVPHDVVIQDWQYRKGAHTSLKFFNELNYETVASGWDSVPAVIQLIRNSYLYHSSGHIGTAWSSTVPSRILPEMITLIPLGAYLSWNPAKSDLRKIPVPPVWFYQLFSGSYLPVKYREAELLSLSGKAKLKLKTTVELLRDLGVPDDYRLSFLSQKFVDSTGAVISVFKNGDYGAFEVKGKSGKSVVLPVNRKFKALKILHCNNRQPLKTMHQLARKLKGQSLGNYRINYVDGTSVNIKLTRYNVTWWNDGIGCRDAEPLIFESMNNEIFFNIPLLAWQNPYPEKEVQNMVISGASVENLDLFVLSIMLMN